MTVSDLAFMLTVSLAHDPAFRGYIIAPITWSDGKPPCVLVAINEPGKMGKRGNRAFALADLVPVLTRNSR